MITPFKHTNNNMIDMLNLTYLKTHLTISKSLKNKQNKNINQIISLQLPYIQLQISIKKSICRHLLFGVLYFFCVAYNRYN